MKKWEAERRKKLLEKFFQLSHMPIYLRDPDHPDAHIRPIDLVPTTDDTSEPQPPHYTSFEKGEDRFVPLREIHKSLLAMFNKILHGDTPQKPLREFLELLMQSSDHFSRFVVALIGGLFLIIPMVIMTHKPSITKSLIVVSGFLFLFSMILAFGMRATKIETVVSTATYAAVLVVFVGFTTDPEL